MDGKLSWLDDRQQLAIKTSQGWREVQVQKLNLFASNKIMLELYKFLVGYSHTLVCLSKFLIE